MFWFLLLLGILLVIVGVWGGPRLSSKEESQDSNTAERSDPWEILMEPLPHEEELIKIPEHRPWYVPGKDRRFLQGFCIGLGAGLMVASLIVRMPVGTVDNPAQAVGEREGLPEFRNAENEASPEEALPVEDGQNEEAQEPEVVLFTVAEGEFPGEIAAHLRDAGLIEDEEAFLSRLTELGVDTSLRPGTFEIAKDATVDEVIAALTQ